MLWYAKAKTFLKKYRIEFGNCSYIGNQNDDV